MATLALGTNLTLAEIVRREDPNGTLADIVDILSQTNAIVQDSTWIPCNDGSSHQHTRSVTEPTGSERMYGQGVKKEAGVTEVVNEPTTLLAGLSEPDADLLRGAAGGWQMARAKEDAFFINGMTKTHVSRIFDGNRSTNPLQVNGINNRSDYNALSSDYVYDNAGGNASATANKTSIYIFQYGHKKVNLLYPRGQGGGEGGSPIKMRDFGENLVADPNNSSARYPAMQSWFQIAFGIDIADPRMVKRLCNISTSNIDGVDDFSFDEELLIDAYNDLEDGGMGAVIYCNRTIKAQMMKRANEKGNAFLVAKEGEGPFAQPVLRFWGIPVREVAQITNVQATVS